MQAAPTDRAHQVIQWGGSGALGLPVSIVFHELGHYSVYRIFGFPQVQLHYSSAGFPHDETFLRLARSGNLAAASAIAPAWQVALAEAAGPLVSIGILWVAVYLIRRANASPFVVAMGIVSSLRFWAPLLTGIVLAARLLLNNHTVPASNVDEFNVAMAAGLPPLLVIFSFVAVVLGGFLALLKRLPVKQFLPQFAALAAGIVAGGAAWLLYLGPLLLP